MQHSQAQPPSLCEQVPRLSSAVEQVVFKALAKDTKDRFASVREFAEAFALSVEQSKLRPAPQKSKEQWVYEGMAFYRTGKYKEAIDAYTRAIELDPQNKIAYNESKKLYLGYKNIVELDPQNSLAYNNRGNAYSNIKEYTKALEDYTRAIELDPRNAIAYYNRGNTYYDVKQYEQAIENYYQALMLNPLYANAYGGRGLCSYCLKNYWQAIQDFDCALRLDPSITWFEFEREDAYSKLGRKL